MRALNRKLLRDLLRSRGQVLTTAAVVACGIACYVALMGTYECLKESRDAYYGRYQFPDLFVRLKRAPEAVAGRLREVPGVARVDTRIDAEVMLDLESSARPVSGRILSLPGGASPSLEGLYVRQGRGVEPGRGDEVLVGESFAAAHKLQPGDELAVVLEGRRQELRVVGIVLSPEYVFTVGPSGLPDDAGFGVMWMARDALAAATGNEGAFNDATFELAHGASPEAVIEAVDHILAPYGGLGAYARDRQSSNYFINGELLQLESLAVRIPVIFLAVGLFLLHVVLTRLVRTQREQIASLKALGYRRRDIALHYLGFAAVIVTAGAIVGTLLGYWFGSWFTGVYTIYFRFPVLAYELDPGVLGVAIGFSLAAGLASTLAAVREAARLPPAEAMRPPSPAIYRRGLLSRGLGRVVAHSGRLIVRELERRPWRALLSSVGIGLGIAILIVGRFSLDSIDTLIDVQFTRAMPADLTVTFSQPVAAEGLGELRRLPGVLAVEPLRVLPVRARAGPRWRETAVFGLPADPGLRRIVDRDGRPRPPPASGLLLSRKLAEVLQVRPGDTLTLEPLAGDRRPRAAVVKGLVDDMMGLPIYARADVLDRLLGEEPVLDAVSLEVDPGRSDALYAELKRLPRVISVLSQRGAMEAYMQTSGEWLSVMTFVLVIFGAVLASGVVYNNARVALSERGRDLASLRVLGFTRGEISVVLLGELAVHLAVAIPIGMLLGHAFAAAIMASADPEQMRLPVIISAKTYAFAVLVVLCAGAASALLVRRKLDRLDLVSALKARD